MNTKIAALTLAGLLSSCSFYALATEKTTTGSAVPPAALPGLNQGQDAESNKDKASKKGEESSGANSGADSKTLEKDSGSSHKAEEYQKKQRESHPGGVKQPAS
ncbi:hypothetical protein [Pseudomonas fluorescens]|jgi:hypothetical protein|uniref:Lipoprotein n=1 Tax=Pseudomonas fluorescens TaxID=294 RepID=A0A5E7A4S9_PSEFL|nr:hypothetical protein [Pseudomonas fluorescens]VVN73978.1 hypothetical protein PS704_00618 [Pseudomonas fluorescens]